MDITGNRRQGGFALIEMAIVLVIIGLITAGILVGKSLIRQSQVNSAAIDVQRYVTATFNFKQKYGALPGDMANATSYWGSMTTCPPTGGSASQGSTLTCNGDGNGIIGTQGLAGSGNDENFYYWQHLSDAQLIQGSYTGIPVGGVTAVIGQNVPAGRLPGLGFGVDYWGVQSGSSDAFPGSYGHILGIGGYYSGATMPVANIITTSEAQSFDSKYDDGLPATGSVRTTKGGAGYPSTCATTSSATTAVYNTAVSGNQCTLDFITGF